ncbi:hypothetical protein [Prochlorococcus marinus]|uniref:hypothetical protein n=1 Tax=Prochlorococcus marinus TaxID=1219 RepID=UPI0007B3B96C|nr:hypothetical protein [Prochlorococcus marinus]KZR74924.1 hypothetical protein PMIT1320_01552 [Prochlorococcus marinus str. MIT 1320]
MTRTPRRYAVYLHLSGGQTEEVHFPTLETFQQWYQGIVNASDSGGFVNVPLSELDGEYLVVRPEAVIGVRVEPQFAALDDT